MSINDKAMLVGLTIHGWQARKYDRKISLEVSEQHTSTTDAGRFNKHLLPGSAESYEAVHKKGRELRTFYYENTLPWSKDGQRILPTANYDDFSDGVRRLKREYNMLADEFVREYPLLKEDARVLLNGMFNEMDYPRTDEMRNRFAIEIETLPMPSADDFRVNLANEEVDRIKKQIEMRMKVELEKANKDLWNRLRNAVDNMVLRLSAPEGRFHDTLVSNLQQIVELIPRLNFTGDEDLQKVSDVCVSALTRHTAQELRENAETRAKVAAQAKEISTIMDYYM
jgi:hypothetical protein